MNERRLFAEINPFHAETLWYYFSGASRSRDDIVLGAPELFHQDLFRALAAFKRRFSLFALVHSLVRFRIAECHFNTVGFVLYPITARTIADNLRGLIAPLITRAAGKRNSGIVHDADLFFDTGIFASRRHKWFQRLVGRWYIKVFTEIFVLSPEVAAYLGTRGVDVSLLDCRPLKKFLAAPVDDGRPNGTVAVWIGPVEASRRTWRPLLDLDPDQMRAERIQVVIVCDGRVADGPRLRRELESRALTPYFLFLEHRPTDEELVEWVQRSTVIMCLYSDRIYGTIKTSGARVFASAFNKPFVATYPRMGLYAADGGVVVTSEDINVCLAALRSVEP